MISSFAAALLLSAWWARSGMRGDYFTYRRGETAYTLRSDWGYLAIARITHPNLPVGLHWETNDGGYAGSTYGPVTWRWYSDALAVITGHVYYPATVTITPRALVSEYQHLSVSYAVPVALLALPPIAWFIARLLARRRLQHRARNGLCAACGYDLRASQGACPECGAVAVIRPTTSHPLKRYKMG